MEEISVLVGGQAGEGVKATANIIGRIFNRHGYYVFVLDDYQSLIRGGHNFSIVRASKEKIYSHLERVDVLIALDGNTINKHLWRVKENGVVITSPKFNLDAKGVRKITVDMDEFVKQVGGIPIMRNSVAIGVLASILGIDFSVVENVMKDVYGEKAGKNIQLAKMGYDLINERVFDLPKLGNEPKPLLTGNEAVALGAVKAGLEVYVAYPMTPSTSVLHFLAAHKKEFGITVVQPENEIAVINMALGFAYAGAKTMVGTSGGGFALMQEAFSLAGMSETPIVVLEAQRAGPSTGVPTYTAQADAKFVINAGHGEFPRVVVAPGDVDEAFYKSAEALYLAWKFQIPVVVLSDKHLAESTMTAEFDESKALKVEFKAFNGDGEYKRYEFTEDGVSPLAFPGQEGIVVKATSYEHDEFGITTEEPETVKKMQEKRLKKMNTIIEELKKLETVKVYGNKESKVAIVTWGSTKGAVLEALKLLGLMDKVKVIQFLYLEPFPSWEVDEHLKNCEKIIDVELNATAQLAYLLKANTGLEVTHKILKYDSRQFEPIALAEELKRVLT